MMPDLTARIKNVWLDPVVPPSLKDMDEFQDVIASTQKFCETLNALGLQGLDELRDWAENAPKVWLSKCREAALDSVRRKLSQGVWGPSPSHSRACLLMSAQASARPKGWRELRRNRFPTPKANSSWPMGPLPRQRIMAGMRSGRMTRRITPRETQNLPVNRLPTIVVPTIGATGATMTPLTKVQTIMEKGKRRTRMIRPKHGGGVMMMRTKTRPRKRERHMAPEMRPPRRAYENSLSGNRTTSPLCRSRCCLWFLPSWRTEPC